MTSEFQHASGSAATDASALVGLEGHPVRVEVHCGPGPALFHVVGLSDTAARELRVRVLSALARLGVLLDGCAVVMTLAPAELRKTGAALDLAVAVALLAAIGRIPPSTLANTLVLGELSLDGRIRPVRGVLPQLEGARTRGLVRAIIPAENVAEAGLVTGVSVHAASSLDAVVAHLVGDAPLPVASRTDFAPEVLCPLIDFADLHGQPAARRAAEIAAAGGHNLLLVGPPGSGRTMLARRLLTILPALSHDEALETTRIHSAAGLLDATSGVITRCPFRAPHHTVSTAGLVGGGDFPRPGEASLAHNGVLFLDDLTEFRRDAAETLAHALADGVARVAARGAQASFPARPLVVAAVNPCPCGYAGHPARACRCSPNALERYRARLRGCPLFGHFDLCAHMLPMSVAEVTSASGESGATIRARVERARAARQARVAAGTADDDIRAFDVAARHLLEAGTRVIDTRVSVRRAVRVARTIADLDDSEATGVRHIGEAAQLACTSRAHA